MVISYFHAKILQKLYWAMKGSNSHVILISGTRSGSRTLAKMTAWLIGIGNIEIATVGVEGLL